ncbi:hypothetical protein N5P37_005532 [Trichoderma harzianum]|nr:hypothetical protein N5P37_005532 [Trichoderma harzianum]
MAHYRVESFHINIGAGDAAIHLLTSEPVFGDGRRLVEQAWMIDGGRAPGNAVQAALENTIQQIELNYVCQRPKLQDNPNQGAYRWLYFDGFVITHWDGDHYEGVIAYLFKLARDAANQNLGNNNPLILNRVFYDEDTWKPKSWFYAPWKINKDNMAIDNENNLAIQVQDNNGQTRQAIGTLRARWDYKALLGRNFFMSWDDDNGWEQKWPQMGTLDGLLAQNPPRQPGSQQYAKYPGLYCVAVSERTLYNGANALHTPQNKSSIVLLVIWGDKHISHYFAGDAHDSLEKNIADWTKYKTPDGGVHDRQVTSMKLSHHGSRSSNPPQMIVDFSPRNVVVSAGLQYGHPRWEIIWILASWFRFQKAIDASENKAPRWRPFLPCQLPSYLLKNEHGMYDPHKWSIGEMYDPNGTLRPWLDAYQEQYIEERNEKGLMAIPLSPLEEFADWVNKYKVLFKKEPDENVQRQKICDMTYSMMANLTSLPYGPEPTWVSNIVWTTDFWGFRYPTNIPRLGVQKVVAINIISAPSDSGFDGMVEVLYQNQKPFIFSDSSFVWKLPHVNTLHAFAIANKEEPRRVSLYADSGEDRPGAWDLSRGNPKFPKKATKSTKRNNHQRQGSWIDVGLLDSSESESDDDSWSDIDGEAKTLVVERRHVPLHIAASPAVYIASESLISEKAKFPAGVPVIPLPREHDHFGFVDTLHYRLFSLRSIPNAKEEALLADDDEWFLWFRLFFQWDYDSPGTPAGFNLAMTPAVWPLNSSTGLEFKLTFPFGGRLLTMSTSAGAELTFSDVKVDKLALQSMLVKRRTLVFGLEALPTDKPLVTTLGEVAGMVTSDPTLSGHPVLKLFGPIELTLNTTKVFRNALWFRPSINYQTHLRLGFQANHSVFSKWLGKCLPSITIESVTVVARKKAQFAFGRDADRIEPEGSLTFLLQFSIPGLGFDAALTLETSSAILTLTIRKPKTALEINAMREDALDAIVAWLCTTLKLKSLEITDMLDKAKSEDGGAVDRNTIFPRRMQLMLNLNKEGNIEGVESVDITLEACLKIGKSSAAALAKKPILFLLKFGWSKSLGVFLKGNLWCAVPETPYDVYGKALPEYEPYMELDPLTDPDPDNQLRTLDIENLLTSPSGEPFKLPAGIPTQIYRAEIELSQEKIWFSGAIRCPTPNRDTADRTKPPPIALEDLQLDAGYNWGVKSPDDKGFSMRLAVAIKLYENGKLDPDKDPDLQELQAANLHGMLSYDKGNWKLAADVSNLNIGHLASFWHNGDQNDVIDFLGKIEIEYAGLEYSYAKGGAGTHFKFTGVLALGEILKLGLTYENEGSDNWLFEGSLAAESKDGTACTIEQVLDALIDPKNIAGLPTAILGAKLDGKRGEKPLRVLCAKHKTMTVFALLINIGSISLWFVQFRSEGKLVKRLVKAAISKISVDVPVFNTTLDSPFEQMFFMWVQDTSYKPDEKSDTAVPGISQAEFEILKECLTTKAQIPEEEFLLYKPRKQEKAADTEIVVSAGSHFVVVAKSPSAGKTSVILDYAFGKPNKKSGGKKSSIRFYDGQNRALMAPKDGKDGKVGPPDPTGSEKGSKAPHKMTLGPLSVENIGLWYKSDENGDGVLGITLDATLLMGPIGIALLGFTIGVPLNSTTSLSNPPSLGDITFGLQGLIVSLDRPPLTVAGGFIHDTSDPKVDMYVGGLIIGFKPWMFQAMGVYATVSKDDISKPSSSSVISLSPFSQNMRFTDDGEEKDEEGNKFTFAFIFCKLNGPLFSVGFTDFAGLVGGFGMNSDIALPTVEQVVEFPFVAERGEGTKETPVDTMKRLMRGIWFRPAEGLYWAAAGVRITAFQMLAANIVIVVQFGAGLQFGLFGVATCDVPALESPVKFAHVELGIICTFDVNRGVFKLEAQLSPRSFVLAPQCHLTGGVAMYAWFKDDVKDNIAAGDWVLTLGGYHQAFSPPSQYPKPPRLGISWSLDSCLSVTGEAYFAITPKVCMGGGRLHAALSLGALYAWFDAFVDFLINFEPFHFQLQSRLSVGVRFTMDLWIVTVRINAEVSATLDMSGPPFGGVVHVDFWVFGFDVNFGAPPQPPPAVTLERFWNVVLKSSGSSPPSMLTSDDVMKKDDNKNDDKKKQDNPAILLTCESGLEPAPPGTTAKDDDPWLVRGGSFSFLVTFQFAINKASVVELRDGKDRKCASAKIKAEHQKVYGKPMQLTDSLTSEATILVESTTPKPLDDHRFSIMKDWQAMEWRIEPIVKPVQSSIWGIYNRSEDPSVAGNHVKQLLNGENTTIPLVMGLAIKPPCPGLADDKVNPFNIVQDRMKQVFDDGDKKKHNSYFPNTPYSDKAWLPKGQSESWQQVQKTWQDIGRKTPEDAVKIWAKRLGFEVKKDEVTKTGDEKDSDDPEKVKKRAAPLVGTPPKELLRRFKTMVPAVPLVAVGY